MDYSVGSLADLISGKETPNKPKVIQKAFTSIIKEASIEGIANTTSAKAKPPKREKFNAKTSNVKQNGNIKKSHSKFKRVHDEQLLENQISQAKTLKTAKSRPSEKPKAKKRKLEQSTDDIADSDTETSPKIQKLSTNEQNAAGRIKNKINKETKNSSEYKDKTLFVGNIPITITKKKIKKHFRKYGPINSVRIRGIPVADPKTSKKVAAIKKEFHPDRSTVYAFIRFINSDDAKKAEVENGELFLDHHIRVHCCESDDKPDESKAIFVGNLPFKAEEEELWDLFKPCGPISHVRIIRDGRTGMGKGFAYVNFKDADSVQLALEMENVVFKERELRISLSDNNRANKKKLGKKPRHRLNKVKSEEQANEGEPFQRKKRFWKDQSATKSEFAVKSEFTGTKFSEIKKKKKASKATFEKKKLAKKLVAP